MGGMRGPVATILTGRFPAMAARCRGVLPSVSLAMQLDRCLSSDLAAAA